MCCLVCVCVCDLSSSVSQRSIVSRKSWVSLGLTPADLRCQMFIWFGFQTLKVVKYFIYLNLVIFIAIQAETEMNRNTQHRTKAFASNKAMKRRR